MGPDGLLLVIMAYTPWPGNCAPCLAQPPRPFNRAAHPFTMTAFETMRDGKDKGAKEAPAKMGDLLGLH
ncbi:hypothetical protein WP12_11550 [Sphingomonas sp. SRS2]|nr:hypothetical protein WP12_11550 [Sphingomonas sp. SRS2]